MSGTMSDVADIDCIELVELVTEYLDAALSDTDRVRFEHARRRLPGLRRDLRAVPRRHRDHRRAPTRRCAGVAPRDPRADARRCSATGG